MDKYDVLNIINGCMFVIFWASYLYVVKRKPKEDK
jgi:hypothetical protein